MDKQQLGKLVEKVKQGDHAAFEELYSVSSRSVRTEGGFSLSSRYVIREIARF